jgi:hypothetical protein
MTKYRIKEESDGYFAVYYPQKRFLGIWWTMFGWNQYYSGFISYERAKEAIRADIKGITIKYLDVDLGSEE